MYTEKVCKQLKYVCNTERKYVVFNCKKVFVEVEKLWKNYWKILKIMIERKIMINLPPKGYLESFEYFLDLNIIENS